ncbi:MAG TPA: response regulator [Chloroflexota bacterium]|jgi:CheY-like chemotaxis protein|nr:response regulator [Chloroflexota bacterium]
MANKRVLLIDDEDDIREVAQLSLEIVAQWDVLTASSGAAGILCAAAEQPDAILLDVMMPDMDGRATFRELRANPATQHIPVILLTAKIHPSDQLARDVIAVISKPFDPLSLSTQISKHLGWTV